MNIITFIFTDGSHTMTSKHSDFPVQKMIFFFDKKVEKDFTFNRILIKNKNGKFFINEKKIEKLVIEKQITHRKEFKCPT